MKQGTGRSIASGWKVEPRSQAVNPHATSEIGLQVRRTRPQQMYEGRGIEAPKAECKVHPKGSQGKR